MVPAVAAITLDDPRLPSLAALVVAVGLLASPLVLFPHAGQPAYEHSVEPIDRSEIPDTVEVRQYDALSSEAQRAFDRALATEDGSATVYGEANRPEEFFYSDYADFGQGIYVIEKDGELYQLSTFAGGGLFPRNLFETVSLALSGVAVGVAGAAGWRERRRRVPLGFAVGGLAVLAVVAVDVPAGNPLGALDSFGAVLLPPVAWGAVGATHDGQTAVGAAGVTAVVALGAALLTTTGGATLIVGVGAVLLVVATLVGALGRWGAREYGGP